MKRDLPEKPAVIKTLMLFAAAASVILFQILPVRAAAVSSLQVAPRISFTFDDGLASTYTAAQPTLAKYGLSGTDYVITGCVGMTQTPNTCRANTSYSYMTWAQIQTLQNTDGWEIGSHTVDHQCLASSAATDRSDCQKSILTTAQVDSELSDSKTALASNGVTATDFAPPYGDFNNSVLKEIAKYYASMRQFKNAASNSNIWPYSDYYLQDLTVQEGVNTVAQIESQIDQAIANSRWLVLTFHEIRAVPSANPDDYQFGSAELDQIAAYAKAKQDAGSIQSVAMNQGLVNGATNLVANSSFNSGISGGWTTDSPAMVSQDVAVNGSYPDPANSIKFVSAGSAAHLFSPKVSVSPGTSYLLKSFLNVQTISSGEVGFYIDEYDANGNWISGQWKTAEKSAFVEEMNFSYKPSSANVSKASLQIYTTANPGILAYLDNVQWFPLSTAAPANLMPNGCFAAGIAGGWRTDDSSNIFADSSNNGDAACPATSVFMQSRTTSANSHLFSPLISVSPTTTYSVSSWLNLKQITNTSGEIGFYIDEYDTNGNWISGQYKTGIKTVGSGNVNFSYTPSSANVGKASLQVIDVGNAGIQAYLDDVRWYASM